MARPHEKAAHFLRGPRPGERIGLDELRDVLMDDGYSADERKAWIKGMLNDLQQGSSEIPEEERRRLVAEVKRIIADQQSGDPISDDVL